MVIIPNTTTFSEDPIHKLDFTFCENNSETNNIRLYLSPCNYNIDKNYNNFSLDLETPNRFFMADTRNFSLWQEENFDKIFSVCPQLTKVRNKTLKRNVYETVFFPFSERYIPEEKEKIYDIIFISNNNPNWILDLKKNNNLNMCIIGNQNNLATHKANTYIEKLNLISQSKISIVHNIYYAPQMDTNFLEYQDIEKCIINGKTTQHKSRVMDAAFCKSLILCNRDPFNIIEDIYEENKHFFYFDDEFILQKIKEILENFESYKEMVTNAFDHALVNYTTKSFYKKFIIKNI
jgi:hypothetical protein